MFINDLSMESSYKRNSEFNKTMLLTNRNLDSRYNLIFLFYTIFFVHLNLDSRYTLHSEFHMTMFLAETNLDSSDNLNSVLSA